MEKPDVQRFLPTLAALAVLAFSPSALAQSRPDSIEVVYVPDVMFYSIEDGGVGRFRTSDREDYRFESTHEDYVRVRTLVEPLRAAGIPPCGARSPSPGFIVWREHGKELRQPLNESCMGADPAPNMASNQGYRAMQEMAEARWLPPPALPDPQTLTLAWQYWGRTTSEWIVPRGGEARWTNEEGESKTFAVTAAEFDRLREIFQPYEGRRFECERVITDGAYGHLTWSQPGHADQQLNWDTGCVNGDAADVFERVDRAVTMLRALRDR